MATITYDMPASTFSALRLSPREFAREMRIAACVQWYAQGIVSQGKAAEIAGLSRAEFLEELFRRKVPACQMSYEELIEEIEDE
jgi:predicted HTH domain antitoxin